MAAFHEEFTLCGLLSGTGGLQGVEGVGERDAVLVTDSGRTVTLYKVSDQKPLGSWAVRQGQRITCPAVYNHSSGEYVLVHDEKVLRVWNNNDVIFDKVFRTTLSADVCRVHSLPELEPLVLFRGGAIRYLDTLLADPKQEIETVVTEGEKIIWSKAFMDGGQPVLTFITEKNPDWFVYTRQLAFSACQKWRLPPSADGSAVLDFSAVMKNKMVLLVLLYSSGYICHSEISLASSDQEVELELLVSPLLQLSEPADSGALIILHDSYIVTLTSKAAQQKDCLCIWNTSFQTLQVCKEFAQKTLTQLWAHDGKLFIPHANSLLVLRYTCELSCLASALGKGKETQKSASIMNWEAFIGKTAQSKPAASKRTPRAKKTRSSSEEMNSSLKILSDIQVAPESQIPSLLQLAWTNTELLHFQTAVSSLTQGLVSRCKNEPKFYPHSSFIKVIESGMLSYSLCPDLMTLCLEKQDVQVLQLCLEQFVDIPEDMLCLCLKTFLSVSEEILSKTVMNTKSAASYIQESEPTEHMMELEPAHVVQNGFSHAIVDDDSCDLQMLDKKTPNVTRQGSPVTLKRAVLLNSVLTSPYSETFLLPPLKDLTSEQVILFLSYLRYLYKKCNENVMLNLPGEERLSLMQVLDWMNLILDANFAVLALLPKAKPLLRNLQKFVKSQMKFFSELNKIESSLSELQKLQRQSQSRDRYSIEVLELY